MLKFLYKKYFYLLSITLLVITGSAFGQLTVAPSSTAAALTAKLVGPGVTVVSDTLVCNTLANGTFTSVSTPITIDSGIILCTGKVSDAPGSEPSLTSTSFSAAGDADVTSLMGGGVSRDACALIINFVPKGDTVSFDYQFGSEEYRLSTCGPYNDAFGFFLAGPGVSASYPGVNIALVPGTNIPVAVNSINSGTPGSCGSCSISVCTAMGSGSPFTAYYVNNTGGTTVSYRGYTTRLTAKHWVTPCDTYRIKMVIGDGGTAASPNYIYDSGVFLAAGTLKTNSYQFLHSTAGSTLLGMNNVVVKGCGTDSVWIKSSGTSTSPTVLHITKAGTGVAGTDYSGIPDSVTIPAGDTLTAFPVLGLAGSTGIKTIFLTLSSTHICGTLDTITLNLVDRPQISILTHDTTVCVGTPVLLQATADAGLTYGWTPATFLNNPALLSPTATPTTTTTYTLTAAFPGSLCPAISKSITITTELPNFSLATPDTTICEYSSLILRVNGPDSLTYSWLPATNLSNPYTKQPTASPNTTTVYTLTASIAGISCTIQTHITVSVVSMDFDIHTRDTFYCEGYTLTLNDYVTPAATTYSYAWTGPNSYTSPFQNPIITTVTKANEGNYILTVTNSGLCSKTASEHITVYAAPEAQILAPPVELCQYSPAIALEIPGYNNLLWYSSYDDQTPTVFAPLPSTDSIGTFPYYAAQISFTSNCLSKKIEVDVNVKQCCTGNIYIPTGFTPNGDGKNDVLRVVKSSDYVLNSFTIFDRWGNQVFQATSEKQGWDGTINGQPADIGTYYYVAFVTCLNSDKHNQTLKGDVVLIR